MSVNLVWDKNYMEGEFRRLVDQCREMMNKRFQYSQAYDLAVQAKYIAEQLLENEKYVIESELLRGLAQLGIDKIGGHEILNNLYCENMTKIEDINLEIRLKNSLGIAKRQIEEYEEAISLLCEVLNLGQKQVENLSEQGLPTEKSLLGIVYCLNNITISLIYMSRQKHYPQITRLNEKRLKEMGLDSIDEIKKELNDRISNRNTMELAEAERYIQEALEMCDEMQLTDLKYYSLLNYACVLSEEEEYRESLKILESIVQEEYVIENMLGYVLNEMAIDYIRLNDLEEGFELLTRAWGWLTKRNDINELNRNLYATALYYYLKNNLDMAYAFAEIAYSRDFNICCLRLLYKVSYLKYLEARKYGNDSEYALYRSEYEKYKEKLERRV